MIKILCITIAKLCHAERSNPDLCVFFLEHRISNRTTIGSTLAYQQAKKYLHDAGILNVHFATLLNEENQRLNQTDQKLYQRNLSFSWSRCADCYHLKSAEIHVIIHVVFH